MNKNSEICKFIDSTRKVCGEGSWVSILNDKPYCIRIFENVDTAGHKFSVFNYSGKSDFSLPIVREARGIIIDTENLEVLCWPFSRFLDYDDPNAATIDWNTAKVTEKIDGSLIKVWFNKVEDKWWVSTNHQYNAYQAITDDGSMSYGQLFDQADPIDYALLDRDKTYMFELCAPQSRIIVKHPSIKIYHIGTRHNITGVESDDDIGIEKPKEYDLHSLTECLGFVGTGPALGMPKYYSGDIDFEGVVVRDANYNRIKVKSWKYLLNFHYETGVMSPDEILGFFIRNEDEKFLQQFPQHRNDFCGWAFKLGQFVHAFHLYAKDIKAKFAEFQEDRSLIANYVKDKSRSHKALAFRIIDGEDLDSIIYDLQDKGKLARYISDLID